LYDPARWGNYYKPYGVEAPAGAASPTLQKASAPVAKAAPAPAADDDEAPFDTTPAPKAEAAPAPAASDGAKKSADDILAMIRNRKQA
jgi:hypothetical protein